MKKKKKKTKIYDPFNSAHVVHKSYDMHLFSYCHRLYLFKDPIIIFLALPNKHKLEFGKIILKRFLINIIFQRENAGMDALQ
jgi:hypothetical protein